MTDYSEWNQSETISPGSNLKTALSVHADEVQQLEIEIEALEELLDEAKKKYRTLTEETIPNLLDGLDGKITLDDDRTVEVKEKIGASIKVENRPAAMQWLQDNGHESLIKNQIVIAFGKGQDEKARELIVHISNTYKGANVKVDKGVHAQTLGAFVREKLKEGEPIPQDLFGVWKRKTTKIKEA